MLSSPCAGNPAPKLRGRLCAAAGGGAGASLTAENVSLTALAFGIRAGADHGESTLSSKRSLLVARRGSGDAAGETRTAAAYPSAATDHHLLATNIVAAFARGFLTARASGEARASATAWLGASFRRCERARRHFPRSCRPCERGDARCYQQPPSSEVLHLCDDDKHRRGKRVRQSRDIARLRGL